MRKVTTATISNESQSGQGLGQPRSGGRKGEADAVEDECGGPRRKTGRDAQRSCFLFLLELRQLDVQRRERPELPPHGVHLRKHAKHGASLLARDASSRARSSTPPGERF